MCFKIFFVAISVGYAALGIGWIRLWWPSRGLERQKRATSSLPVIEEFAGHFIIAISSVGFLVAGLELERLQALLLNVGEPIFSYEQIGLTWKQAFVLSTTFLTCLAHFIQPCANKLNSRSVLHDCKTKSDGQPSRRTSNGGSQNTPPSRKAEADSHTWDKETIDAYADSVSGGKPTDLPLSSSMPSTPWMPSTPSPATINCDGRISVDSKESGRDDLRSKLQRAID